MSGAKGRGSEEVQKRDWVVRLFVARLGDIAIHNHPAWARWSDRQQIRTGATVQRATCSALAAGTRRGWVRAEPHLGKYARQFRLAGALGAVKQNRVIAALLKGDPADHVFG